MSAKSAQVSMLAAGEGESFSIIGGGVRILTDGTSSGGQCFMCEVPIPPGEGPPIHSHEREDEMFFVLEGTIKFSVNGEVFVGEPGAFACAPRGSIHSFKNIGTETARMIVTCTPAGLEHAFRAVRLPEPGSGVEAPSIDEVVAAFAAYGITFHGPPLD